MRIANLPLLIFISGGDRGYYTGYSRNYFFDMHPYAYNWNQAMAARIRATKYTCSLNFIEASINTPKYSKVRHMYAPI